MADPERAMPADPIDLNDRRKAAIVAHGIVSLYAARLQANRPAASVLEPRPVIRFGRAPKTNADNRASAET